MLSTVHLVRTSSSFVSLKDRSCVVVGRLIIVLQNYCRCSVALEIDVVILKCGVHSYSTQCRNIYILITLNHCVHGLEPFL